MSKKKKLKKNEDYTFAPGEMPPEFYLCKQMNDEIQKAVKRSKKKPKRSKT